MSKGPENLDCWTENINLKKMSNEKDCWCNCWYVLFFRVGINSKTGLLALVFRGLHRHHVHSVISVV